MFPAKNAKKKKKKKAGNQGDDLSDAMARTSINTDAMLSTNHVRSDAALLDNEWKTCTAKGKSKRGNAVAEAPSKPKGNASSGSSTASKPAQKPVAKQAPVAQTPVKTETDPAKRLKNLRKKLREIETIEQKATAGVKLEKDQLDKIARKSEILQEIESLE